jgi:hypothetical protein
MKMLVTLLAGIGTSKQPLVITCQCRSNSAHPRFPQAGAIARQLQRIYSLADHRNSPCGTTGIP